MYSRETRHNTNVKYALICFIHGGRINMKIWIYLFININFLSSIGEIRPPPGAIPPEAEILQKLKFWKYGNVVFM